MAERKTNDEFSADVYDTWYMAYVNWISLNSIDAPVLVLQLALYTIPKCQFDDKIKMIDVPIVLYATTFGPFGLFIVVYLFCFFWSTRL